MLTSRFTLDKIHETSGFFGALARFIITANTTPNSFKFPHRHSTLIALLVGALLALGHAPTYAFWGLYISIPVIVWQMVSAPTGRGAFYRGWLFGLGYFTVGYYWLVFSMTVDTKHLWLIPFSLLGLPAFYGLGTGLVAWLVYRLQNRLSPVMTFAILWVLYELIRASGTLAFPWLQVGYLAGVSDGLMQGASLVGVYGLSLMFLLTAGLISLAPFSESGKRKALYSTALIIPLILLIWGNGRVASNPTQYTDTVVRLVHPNIIQRDKWDTAKMPQNLEKLVTLSNETLPQNHPLYGKDIETVLWPETAYTYATIETPHVVKKISDAMPNGASLITGTPRIDHPYKYDTLYNSVQVFDGGVVTQSYDKMHLVPFGEFIPYIQYLPDWVVALNGSGGMKKGDGIGFLTLGSVRYRPLVCYEIAFAHTVGHLDNGDRPHVLLNVTNDAWFGNTSGPYQHLDIARMRAIEQGLPVLRVVNRGISAVIDPVGRILQSLPLDATGTITTRIPRGLPQ